MVEMGQVLNLDEERHARLKRGGGGPPAYGGGKDWLSELVEGTRFLAEQKGSLEPQVDEYMVVLKAGDYILLAKNVSGNGFFSYYNSQLFSNRYQLGLILEVVENGNNQQVHPGRLASNAQPKERARPNEEG